MRKDLDNMQTLCDSVLQDLKSTNCIWEAMSARASKLAGQLNNTAVCLSNFVDCLQILSDSSNSINGASRDIGAALTRLCLRQRTLQSDIKDLSNIIASFCPTLEQKSAEWKLQVSELQRRNHRIMKKKRSKKDIAQGIVDEQKQYCMEVLFSQRRLFMEFLSLMVPIMKGEIALLDEGVHIKEIQESVEMDILNSDSLLIIKAAIEDGLADDRTYRRRITSPSKSTSSSKVSSQICANMATNATCSPSSSSSTFNWGAGERRGLYASKSSLGNRTVAGYETPIVEKYPPHNTRNGSNPAHCGMALGASSALSVSANDISLAEDCTFRPLSTDFPDRPKDYDEAISRFNEDLESMCSLTGHMTVRSKASMSSGSSVRKRPSCIRNPPPPPQRRNSAITAATPDAPSILDLRSGRMPQSNSRTNDELFMAKEFANIYWSQKQKEDDIYSNT